jgi:hemoglobin-like flavoprotein
LPLTSYLPIFAGTKTAGILPRPNPCPGLPPASRLDYDGPVPSPATDVFLASLKRCLGAPEFLSAFYERFTASSEEVREKFRGVDMKRQARVLEDSLYVVAVAVQGAEGSLARGDLPRLAERHSRRDLDIPPELYDLWVQCLVETARAHDPHWTGEVEAAWHDTLVSGVEYMRQRY